MVTTHVPLVLIHEGKHLPAHLLTCIDHIRSRFADQHIHLLTSREIIKQLPQATRKKISRLVDIDSELEDVAFKVLLSQSNHWINKLPTFFRFAAQRLYRLYDHIVQNDIPIVLHIEYDNLLFISPKLIITECVKRKAVYFPLDIDRGIASVFVSSSTEIFREMLNSFANASYRNEMEALGAFATENLGEGFIPLPTMPEDLALTLKLPPTECSRFATTNHFFSGFVFDAAAIGQYIEGTDPAYIQNNKAGFINERTKLPLKDLTITRLKHDGKTYPIIDFQSHLSIIANLHIHSKQLFKLADPNLPVHDWSQEPLCGDDFQKKCDLTITTPKKLRFHESFDQLQNPMVVIDDTVFENMQSVANDVIEVIDNKFHLFVYGDQKLFFKKIIFPRLKRRHQLTIHNADEGIDITDVMMLDNPIIERVFSINSTLSHPKLEHIPLGIANPHYSHGNKIVITLEAKSYIKRGWVYANFRATHPSRLEAFSNLKDSPWITWDKPRDFHDYIKTAKAYRYMLCPRGNGRDTHRFWEAVALDCIPIILEDDWIPAYANYRHFSVKAWNQLIPCFQVSRPTMMYLSPH